MRKWMYILAVLLILVGIGMVAYSVIVQQQTTYTSDPTLPATQPTPSQPKQTPPSP